MQTTDRIHISAHPAPARRAVLTVRSRGDTASPSPHGEAALPRTSKRSRHSD